MRLLLLIPLNQLNHPLLLSLLNQLNQLNQPLLLRQISQLIQLRFLSQPPVQLLHHQSVFLNVCFRFPRYSRSWFLWLASPRLWLWHGKLVRPCVELGCGIHSSAVAAAVGHESSNSPVQSDEEPMPVQSNEEPMPVEKTEEFGSSSKQEDFVWMGWDDDG